jgi:hypothetical protein
MIMSQLKQLALKLGLSSLLFFVSPYAAKSAATLGQGYSNPQSYFESHVSLEEAEVPRIRKHLLGVENQLRLAAHSSWSVSQRDHRNALLDSLHGYAKRGRFPQNPVHNGRLNPIFIDSNGIACAVGYLMIVSGHGEIARDIAASQNRAYLRDIKDKRVQPWADSMGLTPEECARIQPSYGGEYYPNTQQVVLGARGKVFAVSGPSFTGGVFSYWDGVRWLRLNNQLNHGTMCSDGRQQFLASNFNPDGKMYWNGVWVPTQSNPIGQCHWEQDGKAVWVSGPQSLSRLRVFGDTALSSDKSAWTKDSVYAFEIAGHDLWVASPTALWKNVLSDTTFSPTRMNIVDSATGPFTRLRKGQGDSLWMGKGTTSFCCGSFENPVFSRKGLWMTPDRGKTFKRYTTQNSGLPSDTIDALEHNDGKSIWLAIDRTLYVFDGGKATVRNNSIPSRVNDMVMDSTGTLYLGTQANGVIRVKNDSLFDMGYFTVGLRQPKATRLQDRTIKNAATLNVLGRAPREPRLAKPDEYQPGGLKSITKTQWSGSR